MCVNQYWDKENSKWDCLQGDTSEVAKSSLKVGYLNKWSSKGIYVYVWVKNKSERRNYSLHSKIITDLGAVGVESVKGDEQHVGKILPITIAMTLIIHDRIKSFAMFYVKDILWLAF